MIFITVGSQKFQFNRLLEKIDELIEKGIIAEPAFAQIGASDYLPKNYEYTKFLQRDEFEQRIKDSDMVITHGGTGVIIKAVKLGKKVVAVPRLSKYSEHVDDHQIQLISQFDELNLICPCMDTENLGDAVKKAKITNYKTYSSNTDRFIGELKKFIETEV